MSEQWVELDPRELEHEEDLLEERDQIMIHVSMSPYDLPEAVRGEYEKDLEKFVISFRYMTKEPTVGEAGGEGVTLRVGKNTGRLYAIEVDVHALGVNAVGLRVRNAVESMAKNAPKHRKPNYTVAENVIASRGAEIFAPLAAR